jgi:HK97 family phage major capsid protein
LVNQISKSIANKLDLDAYAAIVASSPVESQAHVGNNAPAVVDLDDVVASLGKLNTMARDPAFVMHPAVFAQVARRMVAHASGSQDDLASGRPGLKMLGLDVHLSTQMPSSPAAGETYAFLMDGEQALTFAHRGPQYATVRQLEETYASTGEILLLGSIRAAVGVTDPSMIVNLTLSDS